MEGEFITYGTAEVMVAVNDGAFRGARAVDCLMQEKLARARKFAAQLIAVHVQHADGLRRQPQLHMLRGRDVNASVFAVTKRDIALQSVDEALLLQKLRKESQFFPVIHNSLPKY